MPSKTRLLLLLANISKFNKLCKYFIVKTIKYGVLRNYLLRRMEIVIKLFKWDSAGFYDSLNINKFEIFIQGKFFF